LQINGDEEEDVLGGDKFKRDKKKFNESFGKISKFST